MKSLVSLATALLHDCGSKCGVATARDLQRLRDRVGHEGVSFITITLPSFVKAFDRALAEGAVAPGTFVGFGTLRRSGIPEFLQGFLRRVFDSDGRLRADASIDCIRAVRAFGLFGKKVELPCNDNRETAAIDDFVACDAGLLEELADDDASRAFGAVADVVVSSLGLQGRVGADLSKVRPRHGPGATADGLSGNRKYAPGVWFSRLATAGFSFERWGRACPSPIEPDEEYQGPDLLSPEQELPSKVITVPKTLKSPRVIALEPTCMQYAQQALKDILVSAISHGRITAGRVNFADQTVNQELARSASVDGSHSTIDLSEASDRVSSALVKRMFKRAPVFRDLLFACRSTRARLPDGRVIVLKKFASMGSAVCFPVEALAFFCAIVSGRIRAQGKSVTTQTVREYARGVYVYGDDLLVPTDETPSVCDHMEALGFRVNRSKSFWTGNFRESCGEDWFRGHRVTPVYLRSPGPADRADASAIVSGVATVNQLWDAGYRVAARRLKSAVEAHAGRLPAVPPDSPIIGWTHDSEVGLKRRWDRHLQRYRYRGYVARSVERNDPLEGDPALVKCLHRIQGTWPSQGSRPTRSFWDPPRVPDARHLQVSAMRYAITLQRSWVLL
ncbi:RNA-directed RNA polymerase [ssRNA phage SRR7976357_10]|uniref:RNA-directed RNA polymerase n=1 Tax=ssRNA phage SRR7976357_10 TaxID=2786739 RepID=A0A8S5L1D2_9VIRU|nr:RNA-directed RNA polymerase [ssRNA phage SRR7976357_10]DAD51239.1 TPA_asm: RNA-directed RNA polymerase [ssRNA phage SRR7976357_10]